MFSGVGTISLAFFISLPVSIASKKQDCIFSIQIDTNELQPLLLKPNYKHTRQLNAFILPNNTGHIHIKNWKKVSLHCPQSYLVIKDQTTAKSSAIATCVGNNTFLILKKRVSISDIICKEHADRVSRISGKKCLSNYVQIDLGIELNDGKFLKHIEVCYDNVMQAPLYSMFKMTRFIGGQQQGSKRPDFEIISNIDGNYYPNTLYTKQNQRIIVNELVGLDANNTKYVHETGTYYLARGHLTANADFPYASQRRITFFYVNSAPQWQNFNGGNWNNLEMSLRQYASNNNVDLQVYTGTYGVATLPKEKGAGNHQVPLYLYTDENNNQAMPVPELFWKVIHNTRDKSGVALIGVNNPYRNNTAPICKDVCSEISWIKWKPNDNSNGYCYCCSVSDFRRTVKTFPSFQVNKLLT